MQVLPDTLNAEDCITSIDWMVSFKVGYTGNKLHTYFPFFVSYLLAEEM